MSNARLLHEKAKESRQRRADNPPLMDATICQQLATEAAAKHYKKHGTTAAFNVTAYVKQKNVIVARISYGYTLLRGNVSVETSQWYPFTLEAGASLPEGSAVVTLAAK